MSMENVTGTSGARKALGTVARSVKTRAKVVQAALAVLDEEEDLVDIGHRATVQAIDDDRAVLAEEGEQLTAALFGPPTSSGETEHPADDETTPPPGDETAETPAEETNGDATAVATAAATAHVTINQVLDVRNWSLARWAWAALGVVVGFVVLSFWPDWPGRNIESDTLQGIVDALWAVGHIAAGFFVGGLLGYRWEHRRVAQ